MVLSRGAVCGTWDTRPICGGRTWSVSVGGVRVDPGERERERSLPVHDIICLRFFIGRSWDNIVHILKNNTRCGAGAPQYTAKDSSELVVTIHRLLVREPVLPSKSSIGLASGLPRVVL